MQGDWIPVRVEGRPDDEWYVMDLRTQCAYGPVGGLEQARAVCANKNAGRETITYPRLTGTTPEEVAARAAQRATDRAVAAFTAQAAAAGMPEGPATYTTTGLTAGGLDAFDASDLDDLLRLAQQFRAEQARIDAGMAKALRDLITRSNTTGIADWADRFGVRYGELFAVLYDAHPISGRLWDGIRRHFTAELTRRELTAEERDRIARTGRLPPRRDGDDTRELPGQPHVVTEPPKE